MMTDEDTPDSKSINPENSPEVANKKGQMLVIYLPEGSVIVDRTDMNLPEAPNEIVEQVAKEPEKVISEPEVKKPVAQEIPPTLHEVVQIAVQAALQITGQTSNQPPKVEAAAPMLARGHHVRKRRKMNWVFRINTAYVIFLLLVTIVPSMMNNVLNLAIYSSKLPHTGVSINKGDLIETRLTPAIYLKESDVLLIRNETSWFLDIRQVTSSTSSGGMTTINTAATAGPTNPEAYVVSDTSKVYKVARVVPGLGYTQMVLASTPAKVLGGLFILGLNLLEHRRRGRRRQEQRKPSSGY